MADVGDVVNTTFKLVFALIFLALLIGNVTAFPIRALRHQLPHYMGIYTPRMGTQLLLMGQGLRVLSILLVGFVYYLLT